MLSVQGHIEGVQSPPECLLPPSRAQARQGQCQRIGVDVTCTCEGVRHAEGALSISPGVKPTEPALFLRLCSLRSGWGSGHGWVHWLPPLIGVAIAVLYLGSDLPLPCKAPPSLLGQEARRLLTSCVCATAVLPLAPFCSWRFISNFNSWNVA